MVARVRKMVAAITAVMASGYLMMGPGTGCTSFVGESSFVATDFCFIFDCQNGILGGTIDPCPPQPEDAPGAFVAPSGPLFVDCAALQNGP